MEQPEEAVFLSDQSQLSRGSAQLPSNEQADSATSSSITSKVSVPDTLSTSHPPPPPTISSAITAPLIKLEDVPPQPSISTAPSLPTSLATVLDSLERLQAEHAKLSPPSLHANEELLSEDEMDEEEEMETQPLPSDQRSGSVSPYPADDDSFASFVAREVQDSASALGDSSLSPSPPPHPSSSQSDSDIHALVSFAHSHSTKPQSTLREFGVTAVCPPRAVQIPEGALPAPLDMTAHNFPKRSKYAHRAAISAMHPYNKTRGGGASVAKTLDLLKAVLQSSFNSEVKRLCDDYLHIFTLAAVNIRENTGDNVPEATIKLLVCKMLEEAHLGFQNDRWEFPSGKLPRNEKVVEAKGSPMSTKKTKTERGESRYGPTKRARKAPTERHTEKSSGWRWGMDKRRVDPVKWEPEKMTTEIDFVLGVNVNKALGHAANRGKVYYLHPELFKYACDGDDKTWLYENKHLPVHGGKAFLMIFSEVKALVKTDEYYKDNPEVWQAVHKLQRFSVPQFMIAKMKSFMHSVQGYFAQEASSLTATSGEGSGRS